MSPCLSFCQVTRRQDKLRYQGLTVLLLHDLSDDF